MKTKLMLLIFSLLFMVIASCSKEGDDETSDPTPTWDGTTESKPEGADGDSFEITEPEHLAWLAKAVNEGNSFKNKTITLKTDIDLDNKEWPMIGTLTADPNGEYNTKDYTGEPFSGTFNGDNNIIKNLKIEQPDRIGVGLFGFVADGATIKNLRVEGGAVNGGGFVGGIVGKGVGRTSNDDATTSIVNTTEATKITLERVSVGAPLTVTGGTASKASIVNNANAPFNARPTGGVAGSILGGDMSYAYNDGALVKGTDWVAGVIACLHDGQLIHSYNSANVGIVEGGYGNIIGGVTAHSLADNKRDWPTTVSARTFNVFNQGTIDGKEQVGGVLAWHELGDISGSFNIGNVDGDAGTTGQIVGKTITVSPNPTVGLKGKNKYLPNKGLEVGNGEYGPSGIAGEEFTGQIDGNELAEALNAQAGGEDIWVEDGSGVKLK